MPPDASVIAHREQLYRRFWGRRIAGRYRSAASEIPRVDVYAFRPTWKPWAPARPYYVYMTAGLSDTPMPDTTSGAGFSRTELSCYATNPSGFGAPQQDEIAKWLHALPQILLNESLRISPGDTLNIGQPLAPDSEMSAFYFGFTPFVDQDALRRATIHADAVAHLIPISEAERSLAERGGSLALPEAFQRAAVPPVFDLNRRSCV